MATWRMFDSHAARREPSLKRGRAAMRRPAPRSLRVEPFEERVMFAITGPQLISVIPNQGAVINNGDTLKFAPTQLTFQFQNGETINPATLGGIQITPAAPAGTTATPLTPGFIGIGSSPNDVVFRFATTVPDGAYQISIAGSGPNALADSNGNVFNGGVNFTETFNID